MIFNPETRKTGLFLMTKMVQSLALVEPWGNFQNEGRQKQEGPHLGFLLGHCLATVHLQ